MFEPEDIPPEVWGIICYRLDCKPSEARDHISAAINAWPDMSCRPTFGPSRIILPLKEPSE